jgi:hypothetical protein
MGFGEICSDWWRYLDDLRTTTRDCLDYVELCTRADLGLLEGFLARMSKIKINYNSLRANCINFSARTYLETTLFDPAP